MRANLGQPSSEKGQYYLPHAPEDVGFEEIQKMKNGKKRKTWAVIGYHQYNNSSKPKNIFRGLLSSII